MYYKIEKFCKEQRISINQMCTNLGIAPQIISNLKSRCEEHPNAGLSAENTAKIAEFMGVSVSELIAKKED